MIHLTVQQLSAALDGALTGPSLDLVVRHLAACHACRDRQARLAKHDDALRRLLAQDPGEAFMNDLSQRAEAWVLAIARGTPEPIPHTSSPLPGEHDPASEAEPPPPPPRPELGRAGELASEAGWGRIGVKPTASTTAPESDPEEAQRLMEALERGDMDEFTELTAQGLRENTPVDGPVFDLPGWLKEQSRRAAEPREGPREVPKVSVFFEQLDERAAGLTRAAINEVFRRDEPTAPSVPEEETSELPPGHEEFAPPGWRPVVISSEPSEPRPTVERAAPLSLPPLTQAFARADAEQRSSAPLEPTSEPASPFAPAPVAMYPTAEATRARTPRKTDHSLVLAVTTLSGLALVLLALQLTPAGPSDTGSASRGFKMPTVQFRPNQTTAEGSTPAPRGRVRTAATTPVIEQVVSPEATSSNDTAAVDTTLGDIPGIPPVIAPETTAVVETPQANRMTTRHDTPPTATKLREPSHRVPARSGSEVRPAVAVAAPVIKDDTDWPLLCGVVTDAAGQPIPGARVTATEIALSMRTDTKGRFCLSAPAGTQHLLIEAAGFTQTREAVQISAGLPELRLTLAR